MKNARKETKRNCRESYVKLTLVFVLFSNGRHILQVSDDEDDTHPNIDTPSLFKWRHEARIQRMEELEQKKKDAENLKKK